MSKEINKMKHLMIIVLACFLISGCTTKNKHENVNFDTEKVAYEMIEAADFGVTFNADASYLNKTYGFDENMVSEYKGIFGTMIDANRLLIFEASDMKHAEALRKVLEEIQENLKLSFKDYLPDVYEVAMNSEIIEKGKYIVFISSPNKEEAKKVFDEQFKEE